MKTRRNQRTSKRVYRRHVGGDEFLTSSQHSHLKKILKKMGPSYYPIHFIWEQMNKTAKGSQYVESPDQIYNYIYYKTLSPENTAWSIVDNQFIRYIPPKYSQSGYTVKNIYTYKN